MDRRHASDSQWFVSPKINLREFLETAYAAEESFYKSLGRPHNVDVKEETYHEAQLELDFAKLADCSKGTARNLFEKELKLENFLNDPEKDEVKREWEDDMDGVPIPKDSGLKVHEHLRNRIAGQTQCWMKNDFNRKLKYYHSGNLDTNLQSYHSPWNAPCEKDIVIHLSAMMPFCKMVSTDEMNGGRLIQTQSKFVLRGETELFALRKKLVCVNDMVVQLESGREYEAPDMTKAHMVLFPSSFIFIDDTFYVDASAPGSEDISLPIREFMARKKIFDPVKVKNMEGVKIIDLNLRLGQPYVFVHSGTCEHLVVFHDLSLLHKSDVQAIEKYPLQSYEKVIDSKCHACRNNFATYHVLDCERLPSPSMLFCDDCFKEFHFVHGTKLGNFQAFPYFHTNRLTFVE